MLHALDSEFEGTAIELCLQAEICCMAHFCPTLFGMPAAKQSLHKHDQITDVHALTASELDASELAQGGLNLKCCSEAFISAKIQWQDDGPVQAKGKTLQHCSENCAICLAPLG